MCYAARTVQEVELDCLAGLGKSRLGPRPAAATTREHVALEEKCRLYHFTWKLQQIGPLREPDTSEPIIGGTR